MMIVMREILVVQMVTDFKTARMKKFFNLKTLRIPFKDFFGKKNLNCSLVRLKRIPYLN